MRKFGAFSAGIALAGLMAAASPAAASVTTFASFNAGTNSNIVWANSGSGGTDAVYDASGLGGSLYTANTNGGQPDSYAAGQVDVTFSFLQSALASISNVKAKLTLNLGANVGAVNFGGLAYQAGLANSVAAFSIISSEAIVLNGVTFNAGTNLLSGTLVSGVSITGIEGSTSGSVNAATSAGATINYTSAFLDFTNVAKKDFALSLSAITSMIGFDAFGNPVNGGLNVADGNLRSFKATATGSFSSDPAPVIVPVPEPGVWAMMITGFALLGLSLRRRRVAAIA